LQNGRHASVEPHHGGRRPARHAVEEPTRGRQEVCGPAPTGALDAIGLQTRGVYGRFNKSEVWHEFFVGVAGAAAALTGLLFVSLSINLRQILGQEWLPRRAGLALMLLFETLVIAILGLVPGQSPGVLGVEYLSLGGIMWLFAIGVYTVRRPAVGDYRAPIVLGAVTSQLATLPVLVAGVSLIARSGGGLYWLVPAIVLLLGIGVMHAWVLLVEILR
jgi:hypothetical protein